MSTLIAIAGPCRGQTVALLDTDRLLVMGRDGADIDLPDPALAAHHAELSFRDGRWLLQDRRSGAGTWLNDQRITAPVPLADGDLIRLGDTTLRFEMRQTEPTRQGKPQVERPRTEAADCMNILHLGVGAGSEADNGALAQQADAPPGQTAVELSHGIKNILQAIRGGRDVIETAIRKQRWDKVQESWPILNRNLDRVEKLIGDLLHFSRQYNPVFVRCDFNGIVRCAVETLRPQAQREDKILDLLLDPTMPPARMDPDQIYDVVLNLALNALQAVACETGCVRVETHYDPAQRNATLHVTDNGPGIPDAESVFKPFYTTRPRTGLGLGLPIVKKIVTQHAGRIDLDTTPGEGSTFIATIPLLADQS